MLGRRGQSWRRGSAVPGEEAACCGPQLAALMNSFTCCSLRSVFRSWGPNQTRTAWDSMKLHLVSNQPQRQQRQQQNTSSVMYFWSHVLTHNRDMRCIFISKCSHKNKQRNFLWKCLPDKRTHVVFQIMIVLSWKQKAETVWFDLKTPAWEGQRRFSEFRVWN